jgi:hypothetical protein
VLLVTEIEDANGAVGGDGGEDADAAPCDVVDLLVVGNELGVDDLALDVPDGAGGVNAGGADALGLGLVPVEGGEGPTEVAVLVAVEEALELDAVVVGDAPDAEEVTGGGEEVGLLALLVRDEDGLGGRVGVLEGGWGRSGSRRWSRPAERSLRGSGTGPGGWLWPAGTSCRGGRSSSWRRCARVPRTCISPTASAARPNHPESDRYSPPYSS